MTMKEHPCLTRRLPDVPVIVVDELTKRYDGKTVVDRVSFSVDAGEIFAIVGPNGAGKTTIVESIEGLRRPDSRPDPCARPRPAPDGAGLQELLGAQLQESQLPDRIKVWEALDLYSSFYRAPSPWPELMDRLGLGRQRDVMYGKLSGGQKQRLSVALALVGHPGSPCSTSSRPASTRTPAARPGSSSRRSATQA